MKQSRGFANLSNPWDPTVNADSKLIQFLKYCRFKIDTPL